MESRYEDISIPNYISNEYNEYIISDKSVEKWQNLNALINLAKFNNRLTDDEVNVIKKYYK